LRQHVLTPEQIKHSGKLIHNKNDFMVLVTINMYEKQWFY